MWELKITRQFKKDLKKYQNKYNYSNITILFDTQHLSEGLSMEFNA